MNKNLLACTCLHLHYCLGSMGATDYYEAVDDVNPHKKHIDVATNFGGFLTSWLWLHFYFLFSITLTITISLFIDAVKLRFYEARHDSS